MKNIKKYLKLYEEDREKSFKKSGCYYPPKTWNEFYEWNEKTYNRCLKDEEDNILKTKLYIGLLYKIKNFGFYIAFTNNNDYKILNNVLFQTSRRKLLDSAMTGSGTDHCIFFERILPAFACNDFDIINNFLPENLPLQKSIYYNQIAVNIIKLLYYKQSELYNEIIETAHKFLNKKITSWEKYIVLYFLSLIDKDVEQSNLCLQELCSAYQRIGYPKDKIDKCFASEIHGMYRFARIIDEDYFKKIKRPTHPCFFEDFEQWQEDNNYPKGELFYRFPEKMDYMNKIFEAEIPKVSLHNPYPNKKELYKDEEKFAKDLTKNVLKIL